MSKAKRFWEQHGCGHSSQAQEAKLEVQVEVSEEEKRKRIDERNVRMGALKERKRIIAEIDEAILDLIRAADYPGVESAREALGSLIASVQIRDNLTKEQDDGVS